MKAEKGNYLKISNCGKLKKFNENEKWKIIKRLLYNSKISIIEVDREW